MNSKNLLDIIKPSNPDDAELNIVLSLWLKDVRVSRNKVATSTLIMPGSYTHMRRSGTAKIYQRRLYIELLELMIDKFNSCTDKRISKSSQYVEEYVDLLLPYLNDFYQKHQGSRPVTDENIPIMRFEIEGTPSEDHDENGWRFIFKCEIRIVGTDSQPIVRNVNLNFFEDL